MKKLIGLMACVMLLGLSSVFAQSKQVTGTITDMSGLGLPGVSVSIKGTTDGTITDIDGKWGLTVSSKDVIVISFVGMKTQEITVGGTTVFKIVLEEDRVAVEEVMVVAYGTVKKESFTGSASSVGADRLSKTPVISVDQALSGMTAGVQVSGGSGQPGAAPSIRIRGIGSINSSNEPLYVIDGVAMTGGNMSESGNSNLGALSSLNPSDIASMTVLKDAAAAALYGSRA
ncbi:MAG: TonB-dependent receptor plug domain-containing protein, partial [Marinifilaceae bacterium]